MLALHARRIRNVKFACVYVRVQNQYKNLKNIYFQIVLTHIMLPVLTMSTSPPAQDQ